MRDATSTLQDVARFRNARKRRAASVRASGGSQVEASEAAKVSRQTVSRWETSGDREYLHWFGVFERQDIRQLGVAGRTRQLANLQGRLSEMTDEQRAAYCQTHCLSEYEVERERGREEDRILRAAIAATKTHASVMPRGEMAAAVKDTGRSLRTWAEELTQTLPADRDIDSEQAEAGPDDA